MYLYTKSLSIKLLMKTEILTRNLFFFSVSHNSFETQTVNENRYIGIYSSHLMAPSKLVILVWSQPLKSNLTWQKRIAHPCIILTLQTKLVRSCTWVLSRYACLFSLWTLLVLLLINHLGGLREGRGVNSLTTFFFLEILKLSAITHFGDRTPQCAYNKHTVERGCHNGGGGGGGLGG